MIVVSGMPFEARIAAGPGIKVIQAVGRHELADRITQAIQPGCLGVVSFGVAGGLDPALRPGDCVIGTAVLAEEGRLETDPQWSRRAFQMWPGSISGAVLGVADPLLDPMIKERTYRRTGAVVVDMESHIVARVAALRGIPLLAIRVVTDPAERVVPRSAVSALLGDGSISVSRMLQSLAHMPNELPLLWRTMIDLRVARSTLRNGRARLGNEFAHPQYKAEARPLGVARDHLTNSRILTRPGIMQRAK